MAWPELAAQIFLRFILFTQPADVILVASAGIAVWATLAAGYVALQPDPYPLFFGVPALQAHWYSQTFPWKWLVFPGLVGGLLLFAVWPAHAQTVAQDGKPGDTLPGEDLAVVPVDLDPLITPVLASIGQFQTGYYDQHGNFGQVKPLFANAPADGIAGLPDRLSDIPTSGVSGSELWAYVQLAAAPYNIRVDVYDGPAGKGFVVTTEAKFNNQLWTRSTNYGPEVWRTTGWVVMPVEIIANGANR